MILSGMGDSGSWVVQGSMLLGHVFAVQDGTPWSYMIPITQVVEDIQQSLLTCSIGLPTQENQAGLSILCPVARRSHTYLVAFGVNVCPSCKQDLSPLEHAQEKKASPKDTHVEEWMSVIDDEGSDSISESSDLSGHSIKASTVPTSYIGRPSSSRNVPTSYIGRSSSAPRAHINNGLTFYLEDSSSEDSDDEHQRTIRRIPS